MYIRCTSCSTTPRRLSCEHAGAFCASVTQTHAVATSADNKRHHYQNVVYIQLWKVKSASRTSVSGCHIPAGLCWARVRMISFNSKLSCFQITLTGRNRREKQYAGNSIWVVVPECLMQCRLFRVIFDVVALELDKLVETEFAQSLSLPRVLPANPCKILIVSAMSYTVT